MMKKRELQVVDGSFAVAQLGPESPIPPWATQGTFHSLCRTPEELSIVCEQGHVPAGVRAETGWACLKVLGPLDLAEVGILAALAKSLSAAGISLFALSTFDTDYLLVRHSQLEAAIAALQKARWLVHPAAGSQAPSS